MVTPCMGNRSIWLSNDGKGIIAEIVHVPLQPTTNYKIRNLQPDDPFPGYVLATTKPHQDNQARLRNC